MKAGVYAVVLAAWLYGAWALAAPTLAETESQIREAWNKHAALRATLHIETEILGIAVAGEGEVAVIRDDGKDKYTQRFVLRVPEPMALEAVLTALFDGEFLFITREIQDEKEILKTRPGLEDSPPPPGGPLLLEALHNRYAMTAVEETEIAGRAAWVLKGTAKEDATQPQGMITVCFDKETGLALKLEHVPGEDAAPLLITCGNVERNPALEQDDFVFHVPQGSAVVDSTGAPAVAVPKGVSP